MNPAMAMPPMTHPIATPAMAPPERDSPLADDFELLGAVVAVVALARVLDTAALEMNVADVTTVLEAVAVAAERVVKCALSYETAAAAL